MSDDEFDSLCKANGFGAVARDELPLIPRGMLKGLVDAAYQAGRKAEREAIKPMNYETWVYEWEIMDAEVKRLRAELGDAKAEIESVIRLGPHPVKQVQMPLATFIKSRMVARWEYNALVEKLERTQEQLAAAKAASVVPVRVLNIFEGTYESDRYIELRTDAEADTFTDWLRERMKERGNQ
jgi:hypothetical protein